MRPEVSATTAAVLDRMTDKDLAHRYADVPSLVADLEDALAIEAARSGTSTGEATAVIRTLPAHARRRLPFRMRHPISLLAVIALVAVAVAIIALIAVNRDVPGVKVERGTGTGKVSETPEGTKVVSVQRASAHDFDPLGDDEEHSDAGLAHGRPRRRHRVDDRAVPRRPRGRGQGRRRPLHRRQAAGRGRRAADRDARAGLARDDLRRARPVDAAEVGAPRGWTKVGGGTVNSKDKRFKLDTGGTAFRYYLVWITKLAAGRRAAPRSPRSGCCQEVAA